MKTEKQKENAQHAGKPGHTPGPWHLGMQPGPIVYGPNGEQVADMRRGMLHRDEDVANIRLIAAAPDLLEAAKEALNLAFKHETQYWKDAQGADAEKLAKIVRIMRDVIAKAEGR